MKYDLVLLDADGTLFDFDAAAAEAFRASCAEAGLDAASRFGDSAEGLTLFERYLEVNHGVWAELERGEIDKESLKTERFRRLFSERRLGTDAAKFGERYLERLAEGAQLLPGAEDFVRKLTEAGCALAIVTNGISQVQRGRFYRSPLAALISDLLISEELGAEKPAAAFFSEAFRRIGRPETRKEGVVVVGDSWSADIAGAVGFGLDALWFNAARKARPAGGIAPAQDAVRPPVIYEAATYAEALAILGM